MARSNFFFLDTFPKQCKPPPPIREIRFREKSETLEAATAPPLERVHVAGRARRCDLRRTRLPAASFKCFLLRHNTASPHVRGAAARGVSLLPPTPAARGVAARWLVLRLQPQPSRRSPAVRRAPATPSCLGACWRCSRRVRG